MTRFKNTFLAHTAGLVATALTLGDCTTADTKPQGAIDSSFRLTHMTLGQTYQEAEFHGERQGANGQTEYIWIEGRQGGLPTLNVNGKTGQANGGYTFVNSDGVSGNIVYVSAPVNVKVTNNSQQQGCMYQEDGETFAGVYFNNTALVSVLPPLTGTAQQQASQMMRNVSGISLNTNYAPSFVERGTVVTDNFGRKRHVPSSRTTYCY